jgi:hypothetical protein
MIPSLKLPNLPGFTKRTVKDHSPRTSLFDSINGHSIERPPPSARRNISAFRKMVAAAAGATAACGQSTTRPAAPQVKSLDGSNYPLTFHAYFLESVIESATEKYIVRKCNITFYADNTVSVYEMRVRVVIYFIRVFLCLHLTFNNTSTHRRKIAALCKGHF